MALTATDRLLAGWLVVVSLVALTRAPGGAASTAWLLGAHALFGLLLWLLTRAGGQDGRRAVMHTFYPLLLLPLLYAELGVLNERLALADILAHDRVVQGWEAAVFGSQVSYRWIREAPSALWSEILHGAYLFYYPIIFGGPPLAFLRGGHAAARRVIFTMMLTFVLCYAVFLFWPVAGPSYAFAQPSGPVLEGPMARLVYRGLATASSVGAAFPSSHVAATVAVVMAMARIDRLAGVSFAIPAALLTVGTVYTQMHYAVDALVGLVVGIGAVVVVEKTWKSTDVEVD